VGELSEYVDGLPNLCGSEPLIEAAIAAGRNRPVFLDRESVDIADIDSAFAVALHMHQPLIPNGGPELRTAGVISNLQGTWPAPPACTGARGRDVGGYPDDRRTLWRSS